MASSVFIIDNGAHTAKAGYSNQGKPRIMPNAVMKAKSERRRPFIGDQLEDCRDASGLFYILPFQKGYLVNWDVQKTVWDYIFSKEVFNVNHSNTSMVITEPYFNFSSVQDAMSEIFFEEYQVDALLRVNPGDVSSHKYHKENKNQLCCLVVDSGFSFTHIVPYIQGKKKKSAVIRVDMGGKVLTNHLKEVISYRQLNVMDETYVINQVKEDSCFVTQDFNADMKKAREKAPMNDIFRDYVLPDFTSIRRGYLRSLEESNGRSPNGEQLIRLNNERFSVPELLFRPSDVGVQQMGITEAIGEAIKRCPLETQPHLYKNILLTGGNCNIPGIRERVYSEVRANAPHEYEVNVTLSKNPTADAWLGAACLTQAPQFPEKLVTRDEWEESGPSICSRFNL